MSCPYFNQCSDEKIKCGTCMHGDRSYYAEYHEYPADKWKDGSRVIGVDLLTWNDKLHVQRPTSGDTDTPTSWG